jgi:hypothetical protein
MPYWSASWFHKAKEHTMGLTSIILSFSTSAGEPGVKSILPILSPGSLPQHNMKHGISSLMAKYRPHEQMLIEEMGSEDV